MAEWRGGIIVAMRDIPHYAVPVGEGARLVAVAKLNRIGHSEISHAGVVECLFADSRDWILSRLDSLEFPGIRIDFGFPSNVDIARRGRLPVLATLIAERIKEIAGIQLVSVNLSKRHTQETTLSIGDAVPSRPMAAIASAVFSTRRSYATPAFASEVHDATGEIRAAAIRSTELLGLNVSYVTGLPRTWSRLWLPTISGIFGSGAEEALFGDAKIVDLGFHHRSVGERLGHGINVAASLYEPSLIS